MSSTDSTSLRGNLPLGIPLCLLVNVAAIGCVLSTPSASLFFFDDEFDVDSVVVPIAVGFVLGLLQARVFGALAAFVSAFLVALFGCATFLYWFPPLTCAFGCALGAVSLLAAERWRDRAAV